MEPVRRRYRIGPIANLHLTALRRRSHQEAMEIARAVLDAAYDSGVLIATLAVENARGDGLTNSERTYRLMLLDLLALADALLPEDREDSQLEIIVARRTQDGVRMSTREDLLADVVERITDAVEVGLAARGLLTRLDARHLRIWPAADSAGLAVADFIANLTYNRHRPESGALFSALVEQDRLRLFEGLGRYAERRARISERDGDLAVALSRWALLDCEADADCESRRAEALSRVLRRAIRSGVTGPMATVEAVLERLWRAHKTSQDYSPLAAALGRIESVLLTASGPPTLLYRLHNLMHQVANQMGDLPTAERMIAAQSVLATRVMADPSLFHLILDAQVLRALTEELRLDFASSERYAREYLRLVEQYGTVWELLDGVPGKTDFVGSRLWLKARMTMIRGLLLGGAPPQLDEAGTLLQGISSNDLNDADHARLLGYRVWHGIRAGRPTEVLTLAATLIERYADPFAAQHAARAAADVALLTDVQSKAQLRRMLSVLRDRAESVSGHPGELLWRDVAVLEQRVGSGMAVARKAFAQALAISSRLPESPVNAWNRRVIEVHQAALCAGSEPSVLLPTAAQRLAARALDLADQFGSVMAFRRISPY
ncbi:MAG: hypothetical protein C1943_09110 [Halochromatium sp.]|nr:hypothetical protein [Halochromatium sp.]